MSYDNNSYEATLGPSESFRKVPWYFANPPPEIPESTDLYLNSTLSTQVDLNSSLRSQRLEQSIRSIEEPFTVIRQIRMDGKWVECGCIMGGIWVEYRLYGWSMGGILIIWVEYGWIMD